MERQREHEIEGRARWLLLCRRLPRPTASQPQTYKQPAKYEKHPNILNVLGVQFSEKCPFAFTEDGTGINTLLSCEVMTKITAVRAAQMIPDTLKKKRFPLILDRGKKCCGKRKTLWEIQGQSVVGWCLILDHSLGIQLQSVLKNQTKFPIVSLRPGHMLRVEQKIHTLMYCDSLFVIFLNLYFKV